MCVGRGGIREHGTKGSTTGPDPRYAELVGRLEKALTHLYLLCHSPNNGIVDYCGKTEHHPRVTRRLLGHNNDLVLTEAVFSDLVNLEEL